METTPEEKNTTTPEVVTTETPVTDVPGAVSSELHTSGVLPPESAPQSKAPLYKNPLVIAGLIALILVIGAGWYTYSEKTVAVVNGIKITESEFNKSLALLTEQSAAQGGDATDPALQKEVRDQALNILIDNTLILSAAEEAGITIADEDIQKRYDDLVTQLGSQENLDTKLAEMELTDKKLRQNIREQLLADRYIEQETDIENIKASDEEVQAFLDGVVQNGGELPEITDEIRTQIKSRIVSQKQQDIVANLLKKLREDTDIKIKI